MKTDLHAYRSMLSWIVDELSRADCDDARMDHAIRSIRDGMGSLAMVIIDAELKPRQVRSATSYRQSYPPVKGPPPDAPPSPKRPDSDLARHHGHGEGRR